MKKNPTTRIFWLVLLGYILVCAYFIIWTYYRQCALSENSALFRLEGIVNSLALQINGDLHKNLEERYPKMDGILFNAQDTDYYHIHHTLRMNYEANMLKSPVYTMIFDSTKQQIEFIATSSDSPYYRHVYDSYNPILKEHFREGGVIPMYTDRFGMWLSAFAPIRDSRGRPVGVVMADEKFTEFIDKAKWTALKNLFVAMCIILPIILFIVYWLRRMIFREARLKRSLEEAYQTNLTISEELNKSYEKLSSINTLRKEMIANISHDLRTPLTNLSGYIETLFLRRHVITMPEREQYLTIALKESERLKKLIDDLFELSKLEANQVTINLEPFPIAELLQDILDKYKVISKEKNIKVSSNLSENTPWVVADIRLIDRIVQNLMDNAIRYNLEDNGEIKIDLKSMDNQLFIQISNTGKTIDPSVVAHIFDRYFKVSDAENSTGLGLAIVRKFIDLHQSHISVTSEHNWTKFEFNLSIFKS